MVGAARRRARRAARRRGRTAGAAACALWAALVVTAIAGSTAALWASGSQWVATRSSNALDELYYAIVDEYCYSLVAADVGSDDALRSALSPAKAPSPYLTKGIKRHRSRFSHYLLYLFGVPEQTTFGYRMHQMTRMLFYPNYPKERRGVEIEAEGGAVACGNGVILNVEFPLRSLSHHFDKADSVSVKLTYLVDEKEIIPYDETWWNLEFSNRNEARPSEIRKYLSKRGVTKEAAVGEAVRIVKEELLPAFLTRGGAEPRFSADFEQDGVTVDLSRDASNL